jgi:hypothetical protein
MTKTTITNVNAAALLMAVGGMFPAGFGWPVLKMPREKPSGSPTPASISRRARRTRKRLDAAFAGGFIFTQPDPLPFDLNHIQNSTRPERRRQQLGRS